MKSRRDSFSSIETRGIMCILSLHLNPLLKAGEHILGRDLKTIALMDTKYTKKAKVIIDMV